MKAFIIDDNEMIRELLRTILTRDGDFQVVGAASTGKLGLEQVLLLKPDIIFLDILLPDCSGIELLSQICTRLPKSITLMVTGKHDVETVKACLSNGAKGFIVKPFKAATVLSATKEAVLRQHGKSTSSQ